jgi:surface-anchored protein
VKYTVTNPGSGKQTVAKQTITVKNKQAPVLTDVNKWKSTTVSTVSGEAVKYTWNKLMKGVSASLSSGTDITSKVTITVKSPSGHKVTIAKKGSYTFTEAGNYTLVYTAKNPDASGSNKKVTAKRTVTVSIQQEDESEQPEQSDQSGQPEVSVDE